MNYRHPELQRLLNNLNNASQNRQGNDPVAAIGSSQPTTSSSQNQTNASLASSTSQNTTGLRPPEGRSRSITPLAQPVPDASIITTWPAAIKHVAKYVVTDEKATARIKHLIKQQQQHEEQWWNQREAIVAKHQNRAGSNTKVADILKELGGLAVPIVKVDDAADKHELEMFDKKVYRSLVQMAADFDSQLRKLGVPFYAIKHDLIITETETETDKSTTMKGKLDKGELRELQKRMLHHLEDLLMDE